MIQNSKRRTAVPNLKISVMWAVLTIVTAACVWVLISITRDPLFNFVWFAIPVIGIPLNFLIAKQNSAKTLTKTYLDRVREGVWKAVGYTAIGLTIGCFVAQQCGYPQAWTAMLYYAFIVVGFGATMNGLLLRENSYTFCGMFSIFSGFAIIICNLCQFPLLYSWVVPLYILCFLLMFIVPAFITSRKIKAEEK